MTCWRLPTPSEIRADRQALSGFLDDSIAEQIACMPVVTAPPIPFDIRCDAWLWRVQELLRECEPASEEAA